MQSLAIVPVWETLRRAFVASWRAYNRTLDAVFYDVGALSGEERAELSAHNNPEGSVLIVFPGGSGTRIRNLMPRDFVLEQHQGGGDAVDSVVVTGVGSSALGTAALARNVADHLGRPVAGVVSGLGMSDLVTEALGGWFVLGVANAVRDGLARSFDALELKDHVRDQASHQEMSEHFEAAGIDRTRFIYGSPDSTALLYLLSKLGGGIKLLVGHSKGNYSIENALRGWLALSERTGAPVDSGLRIVTLGAVLRFPPEFPEVHQFIGGLDCFGMMNSRAAVDSVRVPGAWHTLNSRLPGDLCVREAMRAAGIG
jgi:hypothetical protein